MSAKILPNKLLNQLFSLSPISVELVVASLPDIYAHRTLEFVAKQITTSHHIEFYLQWSTCLLTAHGEKDNVLKHHSLLSVQDSLTRKYDLLNKICDFNKYTLRLLSDMAVAKTADEQAGRIDEGSDAEEEEDDDDLTNLILVRQNTNGNGHVDFEERSDEDDDSD